MHSTSRRERVRFHGISYETRPDGTSRVAVELEWEGVIHRGEGTGTGTLEGDLRASGEAMAAAAQSATKGAARITLLGIKAVRAFDGRVVIAAVDVATPERHHKLLGAHAFTGGDLPREAALTVLDALNRILGPLIQHEEVPSEEVAGRSGGEDGP